MITAGQSIGNYRILSKIGTGGMGAVYLAEHPLIGKRVALKVIHRELASNRDVVSRFFQEARAVNKIGNEHIVEVHDFGVTPDGDHFFIMEYLVGKTLASVLTRETLLDVMRALHIGEQIAAALAAAHVAGIIHRDLKPDNIMLLSRLGEQDFVKVLDFGLAKVFSAATAVKTAQGVLLGTPQYMSPEACESKGVVDHRTDIYALGVLLFQMMTGALPFDGESMGEVLVKQVTGLPPAPRGLNPAIPPSVEQILLRCLAKPVDARFATMLDLRDALLDPEAYLRGSPPIAPARSVGPGEALVDAKAVIGFAGERKGRLAPAAPASPHDRTRIAAAPLPLPAPAPSVIGNSLAPTLIGEPHAAVKRPPGATGATVIAPELQMNTMRIATPHGYSSRAPRKVWPVVLAMALVLGLGGGGVAVWCGRSDSPAEQGGSELADGTAGGSSDTVGGGEVAGAGASAAGASGTRSSQDASGTSTSAVDSAPSANGSSANGSSTGAGGASTGAAGSARSANGSSSSESGASTGAGGGAPPGTGTAASDRRDARGAGSGTPTTSAGGMGRPPSSLARLSIDSLPSGASVLSADGSVLGKTPLKLAWPISDLPVTFELRLGGYKRKLKQTVVNGNTALRIELEHATVVRRPPSRSREPASGSSDNALMRPE